MLSLSPRFDLFKFEFPKNWIPDEIQEKYQKILLQTPGVISDPLSYLNESIQQITIPSINDLTFSQQQRSFNTNVKVDRGAAGLGKLQVEPKHDNFYKTTQNPLDNIDKEFTVTLRQNQGLLNYYMVLETILWHNDKGEQFNRGEDVFTIELLGETGNVNCRIRLLQPLATGIDGIEFSYSKTDRPLETFDIKFNFNNIKYEFPVK